MTVLSTTDIGPGQRATVTVDAKPGGGATITLDVTEPQPEPETLLIGMEGPVGAATSDIIAAYPGLRYMRDFGKDGTDTDTDTELTAHGTGKLAVMPAGCVPHVSWKDAVGGLTAWLDGLTRPVYLSWYHEPEGDIASATFRTEAGRIPGIVAAHPNGHLVLGNGPILTRYNLDEENVNPLDWWYSGATFFGIDCYTQDTSRQWNQYELFGKVFDRVRDAIGSGVRLLVPEMGRVLTSTGAQGRADALRDDLTYLRASSDVDAVAYFNSSAFPQYAFSSTSPEADVWRSFL